MSTSELPFIDLNALVNPVARVKIDDTMHDVLPVQGEAMAIFEAIYAEQRTGKDRTTPLSKEDQEAETLQYLDRARRIVYAVAPSIPKSRVLTMTAPQLTAIASLSMDAVKKVQDVRSAAEKKDGGTTRRVPRTTSRRK